MSDRIDPKKAVHLKPNQRTLPAHLRRKRNNPPSTGAGEWERHRGDAALDPWGVALRELRARGVAV